MNTKNAFSAAQSRSKKMAGKMASNDINASLAANVLTAASAFKATSFGQSIAQENKPQRSLPDSTDAKPSIAAYGKRKSGNTIRCPKKPTSSWIPPISGAILA
ncbi:hypothetical protein [Cardiobacterium hominis]|uniref:hypothetical protein n=1 Tax=Cardiobacterium hominis TaxID=2718 RepID=UPI0028D7A4E8|nr:hypothetical protein [Cardiobacterium hominis]